MDSRLLNALRRQIAAPVPAISFFHGATKAETERNVLTHFAAAYARRYRNRLGQARLLSGTRNRPDALAIRPGGRRVAIEITELCSEEVRRRNANAAALPRWSERWLARWSVDRARTGLIERLTDKDGKTEPGWDEWWVVIHEDQPLLERHMIDGALALGPIPGLANISRAFLLSADGPGGCVLSEIAVGC